MAKKSIAWKFFDISTTPHMSKCKLCDSLITRGGKSFKSYGTTAMVKHLRLKHSKDFELAEEKKKVQSLPSISEASVASTTNTVQNLETFEIPLSKIHLIFTDNASNIKAAVKISGMLSIPCFIHTLQLCIHDSIFSQETIKEILTLCRGITTHFNHSPIACAKLKSIQQQLSTVPHKMKQDVPTCWNSSFEMLQRTFEQKVPFATYAAVYDEIKLPTNYQWGIVKKLVHILAPFENLTKKCDRRDETCAQIIPSVLALKVLLQKASSSDIYAGIMTMIDELIKSVTKRLDKFLLNKML
nr:zinc finger BED domain-containing protein 4-like [Hydra vulgaris]